MFLFSLLSSSAPSPFDRMSMRLNRSPNQSWLPEGGLVWRHLTATKSRDAAAPPGCERHQLHLNSPQSQIANCICLIVQNVFVLNCQMYLSGKKPRCCPAASATSFTLSTNLHLVHPLKKGFPDNSCFLGNRRIEEQFQKSYFGLKIPKCCGQHSNSLPTIVVRSRHAQKFSPKQQLLKTHHRRWIEYSSTNKVNVKTASRPLQNWQRIYVSSYLKQSGT